LNQRKKGRQIAMLRMLKRGTYLKLMAAFSAIFVMMLAVPIAHGGRWSGTDPIVDVNGQRINVYIEWPTEHNCDVGDINITILLPLLGDSNFVGESSDRFRCPEGGRNTVRTYTQLQQGMVEMVNVIGLLESSDSQLSQNLDLSKDGGLLGGSLLGGTVDGLVGLTSSTLEGDLEAFPVRMYVYRNGELVSKCSGMSNLPIECLPTTTSSIPLVNGLLGGLF
jgi:hypothetical protein